MELVDTTVESKDEAKRIRKELRKIGFDAHYRAIPLTTKYIVYYKNLRIRTLKR